MSHLKIIKYHIRHLVSIKQIREKSIAFSKFHQVNIAINGNFFVCGFFCVLNYQNKNKIHVKMTEYELNTCNTLHYKQQNIKQVNPRGEESLLFPFSSKACYREGDESTQDRML